MKRRRAGRIVLPAVILVTTLAIWVQSLLPAVQSQVQSDAVKGLLSQFLGQGPLALFLLTHIRKVAHFTEFALLGAEWSLYARSRRRRQRRWLWTAVMGLPTAMMDELLQFGSEGRSPQIGDVLLDSGGYACGFLLVLGAVWLWGRFRRRKT